MNILHVIVCMERAALRHLGPTILAASSPLSTATRSAFSSKRVLHCRVSLLFVPRISANKYVHPARHSRDTHGTMPEQLRPGVVWAHGSAIAKLHSSCELARHLSVARRAGMDAREPCCRFGCSSERPDSVLRRRAIRKFPFSCARRMGVPAQVRRVLDPRTAIVVCSRPSVRRAAAVGAAKTVASSSPSAVRAVVAVRLRNSPLRYLRTAPKPQWHSDHALLRLRRQPAVTQDKSVQRRGGGGGCRGLVAPSRRPLDALAEGESPRHLSCLVTVAIAFNSRAQRRHTGRRGICIGLLSGLVCMDPPTCVEPGSNARRAAGSFGRW